MIYKVIDEDSFFFSFMDYVEDFDTFSNIFLKIPNITKVDILEYFEYLIICSFFARGVDSNDIIPEFFYQSQDEIDSIRATYQSEYIDVIGNLFLADYIDYGTLYDSNDSDRLDYPTNLSHYKEDRYRAWIYFRDNYFYKEKAYIRDFCKDDIQIYNGKEYTMSDCPFEIVDGRRQLKGYSAFVSMTTWDKPRHWSHINVWVGITDKGIEYYENDLQPRLYNKYKDLEVEIDENYNVIRYIGQINR